MLFRLLLVVAILVMQQVSSASIRGRVEFGELPPTAISVRLNTNEFAFVRKDGTFVFRRVAPGVHELSVVDSLRVFSKLIVVVNEDDTVGRVVEITPPTQANGPPTKRQLSSIVLRPLALVDYFEKRQQMSLASIFANPMMLMMLFTLGMGMIMPKMMENMDPEELKAVQDQMAGRKPTTTAAAKKTIKQ